jgi:hypothetical protein
MGLRHEKEIFEQPVGRGVQVFVGALLVLALILAVWYSVTSLADEAQIAGSSDLRWLNVLILCVTPVLSVLAWRLLVVKDSVLVSPLASVTLGIVILVGTVLLGLNSGDAAARPRALLGGLMAGGWSLRMGLVGLKKKKSRR